MSDLGETFWSKVDRGQYSPGGCWVWLACKNKKGYGLYTINGKARAVHRLSFLDAGGIFTEEKPNALHRCGNRACISPAHLYAGNQKDNAADSRRDGTWHVRGMGKVNKQKTHCPEGHSLSGKNLYYYKFRNGYLRMCRACRREASKRSYHRRRAASDRSSVKQKLQKVSVQSLSRRKAILTKEEFFGSKEKCLKRRGKKLNPLAQPIFYPDGTVFIPLNRSKWNRLYAKIDFEDLGKVAPCNWNAWFDPVAKGYYAKTLRGKHISLHRLVLGVSNPNVIVDHRYHDTLDNRKSNLRKTDMRGNAQNRKNNKVHIGVTRSKWNPSKFGSQIWVNGKIRWLGFFETEEEASVAYREACETIGAATDA